LFFTFNDHFLILEYTWNDIDLSEFSAQLPEELNNPAVNAASCGVDSSSTLQNSAAEFDSSQNRDVPNGISPPNLGNPETVQNHQHLSQLLSSPSPKSIVVPSGQVQIAWPRGVNSAAVQGLVTQSSNINSLPRSNIGGSIAGIRMPRFQSANANHRLQSSNGNPRFQSANGNPRFQSVNGNPRFQSANGNLRFQSGNVNRMQKNIVSAGNTMVNQNIPGPATDENRNGPFTSGIPTVASGIQPNLQNGNEVISGGNMTMVTFAPNTMLVNMNGTSSSGQFANSGAPINNIRQQLVMFANNSGNGQPINVQQLAGMMPNNVPQQGNVVAQHTMNPVGGTHHQMMNNNTVGPRMMQATGQLQVRGSTQPFTNNIYLNGGPLAGIVPPQGTTGVDIRLMAPGQLRLPANMRINGGQQGGMKVMFGDPMGGGSSRMRSRQPFNNVLQINEQIGGVGVKSRPQLNLLQQIGTRQFTPMNTTNLHLVTSEQQQLVNADIGSVESMSDGSFNSFGMKTMGAEQLNARQLSGGALLSAGKLPVDMQSSDVCQKAPTFAQINSAQFAQLVTHSDAALLRSAAVTFSNYNQTANLGGPLSQQIRTGTQVAGLSTQSQGSAGQYLYMGDVGSHNGATRIPGVCIVTTSTGLAVSSTGSFESAAVSGRGETMQQRQQSPRLAGDQYNTTNQVKMGERMNGGGLARVQPQMLLTMGAANVSTFNNNCKCFFLSERCVCAVEILANSSSVKVFKMLLALMVISLFLTVIN